IARLVDPCAAAVRLREFATDFTFLPDVTCSLVGLTHACETCLGSIYQTARRQFFFFFSRELGSFPQPTTKPSDALTVGCSWFLRCAGHSPQMFRVVLA
ncbi:unnamed protein product, partial [Ectocarpus sp. 12 AP-2014]